jgi:hypothetical protein
MEHGHFLEEVEAAIAKLGVWKVRDSGTSSTLSSASWVSLLS